MHFMSKSSWFLDHTVNDSSSSIHVSELGLDTHWNLVVVWHFYKNEMIILKQFCSFKKKEGISKMLQSLPECSMLVNIDLILLGKELINFYQSC